MPDLLFSAVARAYAGFWLHANGLFMLSLFTLVYLFPLLSYSYFISFGMGLMFQVVLGDCIELRWQKEGGGEEGAYTGRCEFLPSTQSLIC